MVRSHDSQPFGVGFTTYSNNTPYPTEQLSFSKTTQTTNQI